MRDGRVLHSRSADRRQHPASLTKMMTLYLTFEALERGRLQLDQQVRVSRHASRQPASKLYLKEGQRVSIRHLIRATAIKSANDAAMVLAEAIGGSQAGFARMMTDKARQLGMPSSTFRNPHGLTEAGHLSTARDMAVLARRLYFDFPEYYNVFGRTSAHAAGKSIRTTNRLLTSYRGAEGMKTGYTRAAGFNLVAVAARGQERVIAVVLGGKSSRTRNKRVAELLDMGFARAATQVAAVPPAHAPVVMAAIRRAPVPPARPRAEAAALAAVARSLAPAAAAGASKSTDAGKASAEAEIAAALRTAAAERRQAAPARATATKPAAVAATAPTRISAPGSSYAPRRTAVPALRPGSATPAGPVLAEGSEGLPVPPPRPDWSVRLGAFEDRAAAVESVTAVALGDLALLSSAASEITELKGQGGKPVYEVRFTGLTSREAGKACSTLKSRGRECVALAPR